MLFFKAKKEALTIHEKAVNGYNTTYTDFQRNCELLYVTRQQSVFVIEEIESLINSIANTPKEFGRSLNLIKTARMKYHETESYATETYKNAIKSGAGAVAGVGAGAAVASMAPTAAIWVATTFGTASTGTAISTLSGAAASKAALAWLGGGALAKGGAGIVGGKALLALAGPIGWGIAGVAVVGSGVAVGIKNRKVSKNAVEEAEKINIAETELKETGEVVSNIHDETILLLDNIKEQLNQANPLGGKNYSSMLNDEQLLLGTLVNNTLSLAEMLNKTVE